MAPSSNSNQNNSSCCDSCFFTSCCCCLSLKTGAIIILLLAVVGYAASLSTLIANPKDIFSIAIAVLGVVLALVGLIGSIYENPSVVQFIATVYLVYIVVCLGNIAYALVHVFSGEWYDNCVKELDSSSSMGCDDVRNTTATIVGVAGAIQFLISFLIIWVLFSYYRELKRGYARIPVRHVHFNDA